MKKKNLLLVFAPIVAILFAADPNGVTMKWGKRMADGSMGFVEKHCSFFNPIAAAYGDIAPFLTAVLSVVLLAMCLACIFTKKVYLATKIIASLAFVSSVVALATAAFILSYASIPGVIITIALGSEAILAFSMLSAKHAKQI